MTRKGRVVNVLYNFDDVYHMQGETQERNNTGRVEIRMGNRHTQGKTKQGYDTGRGKNTWGK